MTTLTAPLSAERLEEIKRYVGEPLCECTACRHIGALLAHVSYLEERIATLTERVTKYRARLEVDHHFVSKAGGPMERVDLPFDEDEPWDGIDCRNETIKLQDERIAKLTEEIEALRRDLDATLTAGASVEMTDAMMDAGKAYLDSKALGDYFNLPATFNWHEFWQVILRARSDTPHATPGSKP